MQEMPERSWAERKQFMLDSLDEPPKPVLKRRRTHVRRWPRPWRHWEKKD